MKIGFIGLGLMGAPMAAHLLDADQEILTVLNRSPLAPSLAGRSVTVLGSAAEVAAQCDTIITMLPDTPDVEKVMLGQGGLVEGLRAGALVIDMSSISPIATEQLAAAVEGKGGSYLDAPVSGGVVGAKAANLTIMCGGPRQTFERAKPLLQLMGKNITLVGERNGCGQICKVANQIIVALTIEAVSEALVFASRAQCDPEAVRQALLGGFASSRVLEVHGERMIKRTFAPGFTIKLHQKDLNLALSAARSLGMALPGTALCQQLFSTCEGRGGGQNDHSALVTALETMANHQIDGR